MAAVLSVNETYVVSVYTPWCQKLLHGAIVLLNCIEEALMAFRQIFVKRFPKRRNG